MKLVTWIVFGWFGLMTMAQAASFDCAKAQTTIEKLICGDNELSKLDEALSNTYQQVIEKSADKPKAIKEQKQWLKEVRNACQDTSCLNSAYQKRIDELAVASEQAVSSIQRPVDSTTAQRLPLTYSKDQQVCHEATVLLKKDKGCRPYDAVDGSNPKKCSPMDVDYINLNGMPTLTFKEIATNEYGYTRVFRTTADDAEGYVIIYLEQFNGDHFPRTTETWKVSAEALNKVLDLFPGPVPYENGGNGKRKQKASQPKDSDATEFATLLKNGEKLSDDWSPIVEIQGGRYIVERKCAGEWEYGGIYACKSIIQLTLKKISANLDATTYCQFSSSANK